MEGFLMILNLSKIKTEALLLFCKDLIKSYQDGQSKNFDINPSIDNTIKELSIDFLKQINNVTHDTKYYINNSKHFRIKAILDTYNFINETISKELEENTLFNPAMLYFSLLAVWFKEYNKESKSKEYIYFTIYTYGKVYDTLLVNIKDEEFKKLNIKMLEIAEKVVNKVERLSFRKK